MYDLVIRGARLADDTLIDLAVKDGKIASVGRLAADVSAVRQLDLAGNCRLSAGWIDAHVHCYPDSPIYHDEPDRVGVASGVTSVVDAGSTGADDIDAFISWRAAPKPTCSPSQHLAHRPAAAERAGGVDGHRQARGRPGHRQPSRLHHRHQGAHEQQRGGQERHPAAGVGQRDPAGNRQLPLMVHIGNNPPNLDEIADLLTRGDIITHCYNGKPNRILTPAGTLRESIQRALRRGVLLDVGHGTASFSFEVARQAIKLGILPHTISSDIYCRNRINGPVHSLATVMSKFFSVGLTLPQAIACVTENAASALQLSGKGRLEPGYDADFTLFELRREPQVFADAEGQPPRANSCWCRWPRWWPGKSINRTREASDVFDL